MLGLKTRVGFGNSRCSDSIKPVPRSPPASFNDHWTIIHHVASRQQVVTVWIITSFDDITSLSTALLPMSCELSQMTYLGTGFCMSRKRPSTRRREKASEIVIFASIFQEGQYLILLLRLAKRISDRSTRNSHCFVQSSGHRIAVTLDGSLPRAMRSMAILSHVEKDEPYVSGLLMRVLPLTIGFPDFVSHKTPQGPTLCKVPHIFSHWS